jgi:hypothetical protein
VKCWDPRSKRAWGLQPPPTGAWHTWQPFQGLMNSEPSTISNPWAWGKNELGSSEVFRIVHKSREARPQPEILDELEILPPRFRPRRGSSLAPQ